MKNKNKNKNKSYELDLERQLQREEKKVFKNQNAMNEGEKWKTSVLSAGSTDEHGGPLNAE